MTILSCLHLPPKSGTPTATFLEHHFFPMFILLCLYRQQQQPYKTQKAPHHKPQTPSTENPSPKNPIQRPQPFNPKPPLMSKIEKNCKEWPWEKSIAFLALISGHEWHERPWQSFHGTLDIYFFTYILCVCLQAYGSLGEAACQIPSTLQWS